MILLWNVLSVREGDHELLDTCDKKTWPLTIPETFPLVKTVLPVRVKKRSLLIVQLYVKINSHQDIFGLVFKMSWPRGIAKQKRQNPFIKSPAK